MDRRHVHDHRHVHDQPAATGCAHRRVPPADPDPALGAVRRLHQALCEIERDPRPDRYRDVVEASEVLDDAITTERRDAGRLDGLLADVRRRQPRQRNRVRAVRIAYRSLGEMVASIRRTLDRHDVDDDALLDVSALRSQLDDVRAALEGVRSRESDLLYESYYDAWRCDLDHTTVRV